MPPSTGFFQLDERDIQDAGFSSNPRKLRVFSVVVSVLLLCAAGALIFVSTRHSSASPSTHCSFNVQLSSADPSNFAFDVVFILGAQAQRNLSSGVIVPAFHTQSRVEAGSVIYHDYAVKRFIISGGYNVGVRYDLVNNTVFASANFSFEAFALARQWPSESEIMKRVMCEELGVPAASVLLEETSATTDENAKLGAVILSRSNFFTRSNNAGAEKSRLRVGVLTNLFHMPRAILSFENELASSLCQSGPSIDLVPLYVEDYIPFSHYQDSNWIALMENYYSTKRGGRLWNATALADIMHLRQEQGIQSSLSVSSLV